MSTTNTPPSFTLIRRAAALACVLLIAMLIAWQQVQLPLLSPSLPSGLRYSGPLMLFGEPQLAPELRLHTLQEQAQANKPASTPTGMHITRPIWRDLSSEEQDLLAGLEAVWPFLSNAEKRRWLAIANQAKNMNEIDRSRLSLNITNWGYFNENQRQALRQHYRDWDESDLGELNHAWESYRALAPDVRAQLAKSAERASAPRPAARRNNLVRIPAANQARPGLSNLPKIPLQTVQFSHPATPSSKRPISSNSASEATQRPVTEITTVSIPEPEQRPSPAPQTPRVIYWYGIPITPPEPAPIYSH